MLDSLLDVLMDRDSKSSTLTFDTVVAAGHHWLHTSRGNNAVDEFYIGQTGTSLVF